MRYHQTKSWNATYRLRRQWLSLKIPFLFFFKSFALVNQHNHGVVNGTKNQTVSCCYLIRLTYEPIQWSQNICLFALFLDVFHANLHNFDLPIHRQNPKYMVFIWCPLKSLFWKRLSQAKRDHIFCGWGYCICFRKIITEVSPVFQTRVTPMRRTWLCSVFYCFVVTTFILVAKPVSCDIYFFFSIVWLDQVCNKFKHTLWMFSEDVHFENLDHVSFSLEQLCHKLFPSNIECLLEYRTTSYALFFKYFLNSHSVQSVDDEIRTMKVEAAYWWVQRCGMPIYRGSVLARRYRSIETLRGFNLKLQTLDLSSFNSALQQIAPGHQTL
jgi:hypothetical protein